MAEIQNNYMYHNYSNTVILFWSVDLSILIIWVSPFVVVGEYFHFYCIMQRKLCVEPIQMSDFSASNMGCHCFPMSPKCVSGIKRFRYMNISVCFFPPFLRSGTTFVYSCLHSCTRQLVWNGIYSFRTKKIFKVYFYRKHLLLKQHILTYEIWPHLK